MTDPARDPLARIADALERLIPPSIPPIDWLAAPAYVWDAAGARAVERIHAPKLELLRGIDAHCLRGSRVLDRGTAQLHAAAAQPRGQSGAGQQSGTGLVGPAQGSIELRTGRLPGGVIGPRRFHHFQQALRLRRGTQRCAQHHGQK